MKFDIDLPIFKNLFVIHSFFIIFTYNSYNIIYYYVKINKLIYLRISQYAR